MAGFVDSSTSLCERRCLQTARVVGFEKSRRFGLARRGARSVRDEPIRFNDWSRAPTGGERRRSIWMLKVGSFDGELISASIDTTFVC